MGKKGLDAAAMLGRGRNAAQRSDPQQSGDLSTSRQVNKEVSVEAPSVEKARETYVKVAVSLTPDQRSWLKRTVPDLGIDGLSSSDLARLALARLQREVEEGLPLVELLISQAHEEAERMAGRRNRGMPRKAD